MKGLPVRFWFSAALVALLPAQAFAQSARPCLTPKEGQALITFALPDVVIGITDKCGPVTGTSSFLATSGRALASSYRATSNAAWPVARPAIRKLAGENGQLLDLMPDDALKSFAGAFAATAVVKQISPDRCNDIDRVMKVASPLPPENMSMLVGIMLEFLARPTAQAAIATAKPPLNICPATKISGQAATAK
jgi:hypothetical protein